MGLEAFWSQYAPVDRVKLPEFSGTRIMMMPVVLDDAGSLPPQLYPWRSVFLRLSSMSVRKGVGYLTIDERDLKPGETMRRPGLHVDGVYRGLGGSWGGGGGGGSWGNKGFLTVSSAPGCRAWLQWFHGQPDNEGGCEHLRAQLTMPGKPLRPGTVYFMDRLCVHESFPAPVATRRQFVRLSMPNNSPWFLGYTENPLGIKPTGPILPRRAFMDQ